MARASSKKKTLLSKIRSIILAVLVVAVVTSVFFVYFKMHRPAEVLLTSQLVDALDIEELSTSSFVYNGIADVHKEDSDEVSYSALYHATVKAGVQVKDIYFEVDSSTKTIHFTLPEVYIQNISVDPSSIDILPHNAKIDLATVLAACREDVNTEAEASDKLISSATENLKSVIEAFTMPLIADSDYEIVW